MKPQWIFWSLCLAAVPGLLCPEPLWAQRDGRSTRSGREVFNRSNMGRALNRWPFADSEQRRDAIRGTDRDRDQRHLNNRTGRWVWGYAHPYYRNWYGYGRYRYYGTPSYYNPYYYGYGYRLPNYYIPSYGLGYGYGLGGYVPGVGIGIGLNGLWGHTGYDTTYNPEMYDYSYDPSADYSGDYTTGYRGAPSQQYTEPAQPLADVTEAAEYLRQARQVFLIGDYARAQRLAQHALVEDSQDAKAHELISLAFFAQGNFAAAADAAHAAIHFGPVADWPTLYRYYNDRDKYEQHFLALKQFVQDEPQAAEGLFLLGLHHFMMGHRQSAQTRFAQYLQRVDHRDSIAIQLFQEAGGDLETLPEPRGREDNPE